MKDPLYKVKLPSLSDKIRDLDELKKEEKLRGLKPEKEAKPKKNKVEIKSKKSKKK